MKEKADDIQCPKCERYGYVSHEIVTSSDEAYDDLRLECAACNHVWWIDGIDS